MSRVQNSKTRRATRHRAGFSAFEFVVALIIISVLAAVLLNRAIYYKEMVEKAAMESTARLIKTGLQLRLAELIIANRQGEASALEREDPIQWLEYKLANYGGAYREYPDSGTWYFDADERQLVYVVNSGNRLDLDAEGGVKQIRFRVRLLKDPLKLGGIIVESVTGVTLLPVRPYRWQ